MTNTRLCRAARLRGVLLGTAVGDALGLPAEGLSRRRARKLLPGSRPRHRLLPGRGMVSDDTEHTIFVAQSLLAQPDSAELFARRLAWCLRLWLLALPAGVGLATLRSILKLWIGVSPERSGVRSAGNGPAMRAAPVGAFFAEAPGRLDAYTTASTRMTHNDSRALAGAMAIAHLTAWVVREEPSQRPDLESFIAILRDAAHTEDKEWTRLLESIRHAHVSDATVSSFADELGLQKGVSGYMYHTIPVVVYAWYRHFGNFERTISAVLACGGDTDTTGAIAGALAGAVVGEQGIPPDWIAGIAEWPRGTRTLRSIADQLAADGSEGAPVRYFWPGLVPRNLLFLLVVLAHGVRRLAPPY